RDNLIVERRVTVAFDHLGIAPFVTDEGPARPFDIAHRDVGTVARGRQISDLAVFKTALDDMPLVRVRLADADIDIVAVLVDRHVAMSRPVMLGPMLDLLAVHGEDIGDLCSIIYSVEAVYVPTGRRDTAIRIGIRKLTEIDVRMLL